MTVVFKAFRYRVYPSAEQVTRLGRWNDALRFLWNLAHEQRILGLSRCGATKKYPSAFDQINELTQLRAELPWLADVPRNVCSQLLAELDKAWQRCFKRLARTPQWKRKDRDALSFCEPHPKVWHLDVDTLRFPKLGPMPVVLHRPLEGTPKTCTLTRDVDQWFVSIVCELELPAPKRHEGPAVGIDRGVAVALADSNGRLVDNPKFLETQATRIARAQRSIARKRKGSSNRKKSVQKLAKLHRTVRRQREHFLHVESLRYAKSHGVVVIEKLNVKNMTSSAKGTSETPGSHVAQKSGLNRSILDVGWGRFAELLRYKALWLGGEVLEVPAAYSSQTCSVCEHVADESRVSQSLFRCVRCRHEENADINAAKVILSRGTHGEAGCGGSAIGRPVKQQLRVVRRRE